MSQLLPEVREVIRKFSSREMVNPETESTTDWVKLNNLIKKVDEQLEPVKGRIINDAPVFLKKPLNEALYLKKNNDRTFSGYIGALLGGGSPESFLEILFALEVLDFSVILIDDVLDNAPRRGNKEAHHKKWSNEVTLSVAMYLHGLSSRMIMDSSLDEKRRLRILREMNESHKRIYEGQYLDVEYEGRDISEISEKDYINMIALTTGFQIAGCFKIGGILANSNEEILTRLEQIGLKFGIAGQMRDDLIDYILDEEQTWKTPLLDFKRNKKRIPLIIAWQNSTEHERKEIRRLQKKDYFDEQDKIKIISLIMRPETMERIRQTLKKIETEAIELAKKSSFNHHGIELFKGLFSLFAGT